MQVSESNKIQGIVPDVPGIIYGQYERLDELNTRINSRQFSDRPLQPNYNPRPVPTKYSHFPIIERRKTGPSIPLAKYLDYSLKTNFAPMNSKAPYDGYFQNINLESTLRNQYFGLQKGADQAIYVPSSSSDLYQVIASGRQEIQTHPSLFQKQIFDRSSHSNDNPSIGCDRFFNHTRTQLRGL
jgi:hypothetical protein